MTRYLLVSRSAEYESRLRRLLRAHLQSVPGEYLSFGVDEAADQVTGDPRIALLGPLLSFEETKGLSTALVERYPGIGVVVVREQRSDLEDWVDGIEIHAVLSPEAADTTMEALLSRLDGWLVDSGRLDPFVESGLTDGERDLIAEAESLTFVDLDGSAADDVDVDVVPREAPMDERSVLPELGPGVRSEVIVVAAPKGGQGKTTLAVNLAAGLAEVEPNSVVLVDADVQFGDIANALDLTVHHALPDVIGAQDDEVALKSLLTHHPDGFFVIPAPLAPELADEVSTDGLGGLLTTLSSMFAYVVVDTTPGLGEHTLVALEHATDGVFVSNMTVPSLRALRKEFEVLVALQMIPANRHIVLNFVEKNNGLLLKDAEAIIGAPVDVSVPRSVEVVLASNTGVPLIHRDSRDQAARALRAVVRRIEPAAVSTRKRTQRKVRRDESE
ncbi:CpaE family protein [Agromyces sp. NPDC056379]|uniref:AAA family ATPase n=1 Tax=unclassified Agromyces TaxID=2639701 RepID=UPI0035E2BBCE